MIPITEHTARAIAALIYNEVYEQDPDSGWIAGDTHSAPGSGAEWVEWSTQLLQAMKELSAQASDEQIIDLAKSRVDVRKVGTGWEMIRFDDDTYTWMGKETDNLMPLVRDFLERPYQYIEATFLENDPEYQAYLDEPI